MSLKSATRNDDVQNSAASNKQRRSKWHQARQRSLIHFLPII